MKVTLDSLEALDAIVRSGSFGGAARSLHKAQSAVSYGIQRLEEALGVPVFDRRGHRAILTAAGQRVLDEARGLLARARRIETIAARFAEDWEPRIEAVIDGILPMEPIMRALYKMTSAGVPTTLQIKVEYLGGVQDRFERDGADLMIVKDYARSPALEEHALPEVEVVLVAASSHPLAEGDGPVALEDLHRHVELTVHDSSESKRIADLRIFGGPRVFYLSDFGTKKQAIRMGLGFGWVPSYLVREELASGELSLLPYQDGARYSFTPMLVHRRDRPLGRTGALLLDWLERLNGPSSEWTSVQPKVAGRHGKRGPVGEGGGGRAKGAKGRRAGTRRERAPGPKPASRG